MCDLALNTFFLTSPANVEPNVLLNAPYALYKFSNADLRNTRSFENLYKAYGAFNNTLGSTLAGEVKKNVFNARSHNYKSAREAALSSNRLELSAASRALL